MPRSLGLGFDKKKALESRSDNRGDLQYLHRAEKRREVKK